MALSREICKICWKINRVGFYVPDEVWKAVVPEQYQTMTVCLSCFTRLADEKLVEWDKHIEFYPVSLVSHLNIDADELCRSVSGEGCMWGLCNKESIDG